MSRLRNPRPGGPSQAVLRPAFGADGARYAAGADACAGASRRRPSAPAGSLQTTRINLPTTQSKRATGADVARIAGVSRATVSYVVNGVPDIRITPETRKRVLSAAAELGYSQFGPGRTLKSGRSDVVLFILNDLPVGHALNSMLDELEARLAANDLSLVMFRVTGRGNPVSRIWREIGPCAAIGMDAITDQEAEEMQASGIDVIRMNLTSTDGHGDLTQPQLEVGEAQVRYLASRGHHRLGYAYPDDPRVEAFAAPRLEGAKRACEDLGLPAIDVRTIPLDRDAAAAAIQPWLTGDGRISAVVAYNDGVAFAVLAALRDHHISVPADVAVIGVDNDPVGSLVTPALTTIDAGHVATADDLARLVVMARRGERQLSPAIAHPSRVVSRKSA